MTSATEFPKPHVPAAGTMRTMRRLSLAAMLIATVSVTALSIHTPALAQEAPLTGPAWEAADKAYAAYRAKDYTTAADQAREALKFRPDVARLWLLLMDALEAQDKVADAMAAARAASAAGIKDESLTARTRSMSRVLAQAPSLAANKALEARDPKRAQAEIRKAIELVPDDLSYRVLLVYALLADDQLDAAEQAATAAIKVDPQAFLPQILRGYIRERLGRISEAEQDFDRALKDEVLTGTAARDARIVIADAAIAAGRPRRALSVLEPLGNTQDGAITARRDVANAQIANPSVVPRDANRTMPVPYQSCRDTPYGPVCQLVPATTPPGLSGVTSPAYKAAEDAYEAYGKGDDKLAEAKIREALQAFPNNTAWRRLLIDVLERSKQYEALDAAIAQAVAAGDTDSSLLGRRASAQTELGEPLADQAIKELSRRNAKAAADLAQKAVSRAPNTMNYRLLLISALMASGQSKAALAAANDAVKQDETDALARMLRGFLLQQNGNRTEAAADFERALQSNVLTDTEILNYRLIAGNAALAAGQPDQALALLKPIEGEKNADVADQRKLAEQMQANPRRARPALITPSTLCQSTNYGIICSVYYGGTGGGLGGPGMPGYEDATAGFRAMGVKDYAAAAAAARRALASDPGNANYRMLLLSALAGQGKLAEAEATATAILARDPRDGAVLLQRGYLRSRMQNYPGAIADFAAALASGRLKGTEVRNARLAYVDALLGAKQPERALEQLAAFGSDASYDVAARRAFALQALGRHEEALAAFDAAYLRARSPADRLTMLRGGIAELVDLGRSAEAKARFEAAYASGELKGLSTLDMAYLASQAGDRQLAWRYFHEAEEQGGLRRGPGLMDAAYAAKASFQNEDAKRLFMRAIDSANSGEFKTSSQTVYGLRREVSELDRTWGAYVSASYGAVGVAPSSPLAPPPNGGHTIQGGAEIYWRPPGIGYQNGAIFEVFARGFQTWYAENGSSTGWDTTQGSVGVRWKPFATQNLVLESAYLFPIGALAREDWLLRAAYSLGEGTDLRVDVSEWNYWQAYVEGDYYVSQPERIGLFEARWGRAYRADAISRNLMVTPFLAIGGGYDTAYATPFTLGAGPGLNIRYWFREDVYHAPMSYFDLTFQYRFKLAGDDRGEGLFAGAVVSY
ncbi:TPR repeat protein [Azorhizobium caulinodans ORS 571]|uniref:TPR repeat protein n=1 Tax=Azorhizobium caulinodans (strain ATCC 43989 / DSM 5975 / JCM 20966 / LMG 6465 / NBRC 14845 / NCIMB 13405 / ORS 571) TaxID=438753 RepID=A8ICK7_AZOC5|nr:TPR repeat protein [Azorhizobium caulinodans ORS 571]